MGALWICVYNGFHNVRSIETQQVIHVYACQFLHKNVVDVRDIGPHQVALDRGCIECLGHVHVQPL